MQRVGRHSVGREIASSGLLATYEASLDDGRAVRLRVFDAGFRAEPSSVQRFEDDLARAAGLKHAGVDRPIAWSASSPVHVSTDLTRCATLAAICELASGERLDPSVAAGVGADLAEALTAAHSAGLVHAGIAADSVLVETDGRARLTDFGLMRFLNDMSAAHSGVMRGSIECLSPEQLRAPETVGPQTDVFGLGLLLYRVLTAKPAFGAASALGMSIRLTMGQLTPIRSHGVEIPAELADLVTKMLSAAPAARPAMDQVLRTLGTLAQQAGPWRDALRSLAEKAAPAPREEASAEGPVTERPAPPDEAPPPSAPLADAAPAMAFAGPPPGATAPPRVSATPSSSAQPAMAFAGPPPGATAPPRVSAPAPSSSAQPAFAGPSPGGSPPPRVSPAPAPSSSAQPAMSFAGPPAGATAPPPVSAPAPSSSAQPAFAGPSPGAMAPPRVSAPPALVSPASAPASGSFGLAPEPASAGFGARPPEPPSAFGPGASSAGFGFGPPPAPGFAGPRAGGFGGPPGPAQVAPQSSFAGPPAAGFESSTAARAPVSEPRSDDQRPTISNADFSSFIGDLLDDPSAPVGDDDGNPWATPDEGGRTVPKTVVMQHPPPPLTAPAAQPSRGAGPIAPMAAPAPAARGGIPAWAIWAAVATAAFTLLIGTVTLIVLLAS